MHSQKDSLCCRHDFISCNQPLLGTPALMCVQGGSPIVCMLNTARHPTHKDACALTTPFPLNSAQCFIQGLPFLTSSRFQWPGLKAYLVRGLGGSQRPLDVRKGELGAVVDDAEHERHVVAIPAICGALGSLGHQVQHELLDLRHENACQQAVCELPRQGETLEVAPFSRVLGGIRSMRSAMSLVPGCETGQRNSADSIRLAKVRDSSVGQMPHAGTLAASGHLLHMASCMCRPMWEQRTKTEILNDDIGSML